MDERSIQVGETEHLPPVRTSRGDGHGDGPLADPRALTILSTEHWSLLSARSLVYNEAFARTGMFLTFLSASLVALALAAQAMRFERDFLLFAALILGFDLFIGLATLGRISSANIEDLRCIAGMNRIRHAYLEMSPPLERYFITSPYDDIRGVLSTYGEPTGDRHSLLLGILHGLTTTEGMVNMITTGIAAVLGADVALLIGAAPSVAIGVGVATFIAFLAVMTGVGFRNFSQFGIRLAPRFPTPAGAATPEPPSGRPDATRR
jgi:hypothetical protein